MSIVKIGGEILVNTATAGAQDSPQITTLANGGFVVVWRDNGQGVGGATGDTSGYAVKAQVFTAAGAAVGSEILVNTATADLQLNAQITALSNGGFVVTWQDASLGVGGATGDNSGYAVKAQVFTATGAAAGSEILVNTATADTQLLPRIATLTDGGFVVTWRDNSQGVGGATGDASSYAVKAQVFTAGGASTGNEILVNTATAGAQDAAQITALSGGGFVITWQDASLGVGGASGDNSSLAIKGQVFTAAGARTGSEILVNTATAGAQTGQQITALSNGGFVVTWQDNSLGVGGAGGDASNLAVKAQVFGADGTAVGSEILVNTATANGQDSPQITTLSNGGFVVTWRDFSLGVGGAGGDASSSAVKAQVFTAAGAPVGTEILVNTATADNQVFQRITALSDGGFVVTWQDFSAGVGGAVGDASGAAVKAQMFTAAGVPTGGEILVNTATAGTQDSPQVTALANGGFAIAWRDASLGVGGAGGDASGIAVKAQVFGPPPPEPVLAGAGGTTAFTEGVNVASTPVAVAAGLTVSDDGGTLASATVSVSANFQAGQDVLAFANAAGMGDIAGSYDAGTGVLTLTSAGGTATLAQWQAALRSVTFTNSSQTPETTSRTISFVVNDGTHSSTAATQTVSVAANNDAPSGTDATLSMAADATRVLAAADFGFSDPDGNSLASVKVATLPAAGVLKDNGVAVTAGQSVSAADIAAGKLVFTPAPGASGTAYASFTFQVQDDGGVAGSGVDLDPSPNTLTFDVAAPPPDPGPDPTPPPAPPPVPLVDGVPVTTTTSTGPGGVAIQTLTIPMVSAARTDTVGGPRAADIPLVQVSGATVLSAQVPAGYGLTVSGPAAPRTAGTSLTDLIREIQAHTAAGSTDQTVLTGGGSGFLGRLPASTPLLVQTIAPTGGGTGMAPLVINGAPATTGDARVALVIDARNLPSGSSLQLDDVAFAAVIGAVTVTGGAGSQVVYGDGASQYLFLGADDDELHGGGGTDTVASAGGDDRLFGDDGNDSVSGGEGNDLVHGNAGADTVSGGEGNDIAYGGKDDDRVTGDGGDDRIFGDLGDDFLQGNTGADTLAGGAGNDTVHGGQDNDQIDGGEGDDAVLGDAGDDIIQGGLGNDTALGGQGDDLIHGGQGDDVIYGGDGDDWISGDRGADTLSGGAGADTFHANAQTGLDVVTDFNFAEGDRVLLDLGTTYAVSQAAAGVVIDITGGAQMVLAGVQLASLGDGWIGMG